MEHFIQFANEIKGVTAMDIDRQIEWATKEYGMIRTDPRHMAMKYYQLAMHLAVEREALKTRIEMLTLRLKKAGGSDETPPVRYAYETDETGEV